MLGITHRKHDEWKHHSLCTLSVPLLATFQKHSVTHILKMYIRIWKCDPLRRWQCKASTTLLGRNHFPPGHKWLQMVKWEGAFQPPSCLTFCGFSSVHSMPLAVLSLTWLLWYHLPISHFFSAFFYLVFKSWGLPRAPSQDFSFTMLFRGDFP